MKKVCTGPMEFTPYRPWSAERKAAAKSKIFFWIGERGRRAEKMWTDGETFKSIAATLGTTRSAVAGYIRRKGLLGAKRGDAQATIAPPIVESALMSPPLPPTQITVSAPPPSLPFVSYDPTRLLPPAHKPGVRPRCLGWTRDYLSKIGDGRHGMRIGGAWHISNAGVKFDFLCTCDCGVTYGMEARQMMEDRTGTISCPECATILASRDTRTTMALIGGY